MCGALYQVLAAVWARNVPSVATIASSLLYSKDILCLVVYTASALALSDVLLCLLSWKAGCLLRLLR